MFIVLQRAAGYVLWLIASGFVFAGGLSLADDLDHIVTVLFAQ